MKSKEEIKLMGEKYAITHGDVSDRLGKYLVSACFQDGYIQCQCQEDMADNSIMFAEWIRIRDFQTASMNNWVGLDMKYYTTKELFKQFINSLIKKD